MTDTDDISAGAGASGSEAGGAISWLWDPERLRIVDATPGAVRFWGAPSLSALRAVEFSPEDPLARALARRLVDAQSPLRVTFSVLTESATRAVIADVAAAQLPDGRAGLSAEVVTIDDAPAPRAAPPSDPRAFAAEALTAAPTPVAVFALDGAPVWGNLAARRLFGSALTRFDALFVDAKRAGELRSAAAASGAARLAARIKALGGQERREVALQRLLDVGGAEALIATFAPAPTADQQVHDLGDEPPTWRGVIVFDAQTLALVGANGAARDVVNAAAGARFSEATLYDLFPADAGALDAALNATSDAPDRAAPLDLSVVGGSRPGPWLKAALWRARLTAQAREFIILAFVDLGPERRSLLRLRFDSDERGAALEALGVGVAIVDEAGAIQNLNAAAQDMLGDAAALGASIADLLDAGAGRRLARYLLNGPVVEGRSFENGVAARSRNGDTPLRLAMGPPTRANRGRRAIALVAADDDAQTPAAETIAPTTAAETSLAAADAHAIRTELTTIRGFSELVRRAPEVAGSALLTAYLDDIAASAQTIADRLPAVSAQDAETPEARVAPPPKPELETVPSAGEAVDLGRFVRTTLDALTAAGAVNVVLRAETARPVVVSDRGALRELIDLAVSLAPPAAQPPLKLTVQAGPDDDRAPSEDAVLRVDGVGDPGLSGPERRLLELLSDRAGGRAAVFDGGFAVTFGAA